MTIKILYESDDMLVINKPAGLVVHADGKTEEDSVTDWLLEKYPDMKEVGEPTLLSSGKTIYRPGIVHRLDRETSGALLVAKNQKAFECLKDQFQNREIKKRYNAFVYGEMKEEDGTIDRDIARSKKDFRLFSAQRGGRGEARPAITEYTVLHRSPEYTFIEARPLTGRTHQIRVHFKAINHPVVCDRLYAPKQKPLLGFERLALHARELTFTTLDREEVTVEAPYPTDFKQAMSHLPK